MDVYKNESSYDNFGGNTLTETLLGSSWVNVKSVPTDKLIAFGLDITEQAITIKTRYRSDLDYFQEGIFFKYRSKSWIPQRIYNKDLLDEEINIIATAINE